MLLCFSFLFLLWMERKYLSVNGGGVGRAKHIYLWQLLWPKPGELHPVCDATGIRPYYAANLLHVPGYGAIHLPHRFPAGKIRDNSTQAFHKV